MEKREYIRELIDLFADKTGCGVQHKGCPCNTCFHAIEGVDFRHICWVMLLYMRGDYKDYENALDLIEKELNGEKMRGRTI